LLACGLTLELNSINSSPKSPTAALRMQCSGSVRHERICVALGSLVPRFRQPSAAVPTCLALGSQFITDSSPKWSTAARRKACRAADANEARDTSLRLALGSLVPRFRQPSASTPHTSKTPQKLKRRVRTLRFTHQRFRQKWARPAKKRDPACG